MVRSEISIAVAVWKALFLREVSGRLAAGRSAWLWILLEPAAHIVFLMVVIGVLRHRVMAGANIEVFVLVGVWSFFLVRNIAQRGMDAIQANIALFSYRQIRPIDTVLVRAAVEAFLCLVIGAILLISLALFEVKVLPSDPALVAVAGLLLWILGLGLGLVLSVIETLLPEVGKILRLFFTPLYFLSAVMYSVTSLPQGGLRSAVLANPITHGVEMMRIGWFGAYHGESQVNLGYLAICALAMLFLGLALHVRYATRLMMQ